MKKQFPEQIILYIDDEEKSLKYFSAIFDPVAPILTASSPEEGYRLFVENHEQIALVLTDKKMPNESGLDLLRRIEAYDPTPFRFLVTAFADLNVAVEALNEGLLYSYLTKPWDPIDLENRLIKAIRHFRAVQEREALVKEKAAALDQLMMADRASSIGILSTGLNHHLRNSLTVIRSFLDMLPLQLREELGREPGDESFWSEYYEEVGSQMDRMTTMLTRLAEGANTGPVIEWDKIDLEESVRLALHVSPFASTTAIEFSSSDDEAKPVISGDPLRVGQMIRLLLHESAKIAGMNGRVEVAWEVDTDAGVVTIAFLNDGPLLSEKEREHCFDPFYVRPDAPEELGVNLLACYLTAYHHGGSIKALLSEDGRNAVSVTLPIEPPAIPVEEFADEAKRIFRSHPPTISKSCETVLPG